MYRLIRYYNQNRKKVWIAIAIIVFGIILLQVLNNLAKEQRNSNTNYNATNQTSIQDNYNYSIMSEKKVSKTTSSVNNKIVEQFFEYCNNGDIQNAYSLLSNDCKEVLYPSIDIFTNNYYKQVFKTAKTYTIQSWYSDKVDTYKVRILEDMLSTGVYNNSEIIEDYYTIIDSDDGIKLNINGYVNREEINKENSENGVNIKIISKDSYMDYEVYNIEIKNNTENDILLDTRKNSNTTYATGENSTKYTSFIYELAEDELIVKSQKTKKLSIKFNKMYNPEREIGAITFSDIILNYEQYKTINNNYINKQIIKIDM